ncbi:MAG: glycoside hydrolase family 43 protein [Actinotalea sp.]|nr:glycoside hydrolase family 43 protein [Actinotalea sp.]
MTKNPLMSRLATLTVGTALALSAGVVAPAAGTPPGATAQSWTASSPTSSVSADRRHDGTTYSNPVSQTFADTYADPAVIRGKDGFWYAYGTTDPLLEGERTRHLLPISRSTDLVSWEYVGDAFTEATLPVYADTTQGAALWAPDIRYVDGEYRLYYVVTETTVGGGSSAIGVATSPTPVGPWTDSGDPVVDPRPAGQWNFDPSHVVGPDGTEYLFYGSYYGGIFVTELDEDGTEAVGTPIQVAIDNKYEGAFVMWRDGYWYIFMSSANCCAGPTTGYSVHVARSESITGPYVDQQGVPILQSRAGGTPVIAPNGNIWIGTGHNAVVTDLAGQDWFVYHAIDRNDPYLDEPFGINERPMLLDRLDWIDGWPTVNAGEWASEGEQVGPVTDGRAATDFSSGIDRVWRQNGRWTTATDAQAGKHALSRREGTLTTRHTLTHDVWVQADLRLEPGAAEVPYGLVAGQRSRNEQLRALIDPATGELVLELTRKRGGAAVATAKLPLDVDPTVWHQLTLEVRDGVATAELSHAGLGNPIAVVELALPSGTRTNGSAGAYAGGAGVHVDNLSALPAADLVTELAEPVPTPGALVDGDEFDGTAPAAGWTSVRDPDVTVAGGSLVWQVEPTDLVGAGNNAGILLRDPPDGDWTVETKVAIDLGTDVILNYQQAGLIAYVNDDDFARLSHVAIWNTRQTEFGRELPYAGTTSYGGTIIGPPAEVTWLRLVHRTDESGEHEVQAFTSTDGTTWIAGGVWTFPAGSDIQVGLIAHGAQGDAARATAQFDYLRVYAD